MTALSNHAIPEQRILILTKSDPIQSRRKFLLGSSAVSLATFLPKSLDAQPASMQKSAEGNPVFESTPKDASLKFTPDGTRRPFAGNTVICHLPQQCKIRDEAADLGNALRSSSFAHKLGILPSDSYHMTVFSGPNDQDRAVYGWLRISRSMYR
ncbi:hypothetical protein HDF10_003875 [Edaphobacter lichenicola]|uniref:DUF1868 domain-containing protein n=1 Tax=Tunturiibacter lichenicola TaxID=2051959 RepID=A0A7W8N543_9BACT|nr:hypothetical protein [Edaphobacter lichenicola]